MKKKRQWKISLVSKLTFMGFKQREQKLEEEEEETVEIRGFQNEEANETMTGFEEQSKSLK